MGVGLRVLAVMVLGLVAPRTVWAWASEEHRQLGETSYLEACRRISAALAENAVDPQVAERLELACGRNVQVLGQLYGQATTLAGDFLGDPGEFVSRQGSWRFRSKTSYLLLALENAAHFHPMATQSWREHHLAAIAHALTGASARGLASLAAFELAIHESAFADHFLHDSFCAGHMGFNRIASSAAASKAYHDRWNDRGRLISDRAGRRWITYGDGLLDAPANQDGRRHVLEAATLSIHGVLLAFVQNRRAPEGHDEGLTIWRALPFTIEAPDTPAAVAKLFTDDHDNGRLDPLMGMMRPARKDLVVHAQAWSASPFRDADQTTAAAVAGLDLSLPYVPAQSYLGAGATLRQPSGKHAPVLEAGLLAPIGLSIDGLLSHEVSAIASLIPGGDRTAMLHLEYQLSVEFGTFLLTLHAGLAEFLPRPLTGWFAGIGLGKTLRAAGGGAF
jgi:hypothetical protein